MRIATLGLLLVSLLGFQKCNPLAAAERPNVLWITCEDTGPHLGCYGDGYAVTPHLDAFAKRSCVYQKCWSNAPVCAAARTTIITGMYPTSLGAENMRSMVPMPEGFQLYPAYLRAAGYYCTNNAKTDYNVVAPRDLWDESSKRAHWKNRQPGQPFFAIFNHTITHESQIRNEIDPADRIHDPAKARIPEYHPDTPEVRKDWAQYYDRITMMDKLAGENLRELEAAGLADDTIVFFYGDHGSGMPRNKRWPYNSGLHVPFIVHIPEKWKHLATDDFKTGGQSERLVSFVDLAPTLLSLCGVEIPEHFQGKAFLGSKAAEPNKLLFGLRGRMDERLDMVRSVTDGRYVYIRNFMPHLPYGQHLAYMFETPTTRVWKKLFDEGKLNEAQSAFWKPKPHVELYDLQSDPDEVRNLAGDPENSKRRRRLDWALFNWMIDTRDLGVIPEAELWRMSEGTTPYDVGNRLTASNNQRSDSGDKDRFNWIVMTSFVTGQFSVEEDRQSTSQETFDRVLQDYHLREDPSIRYWELMARMFVLSADTAFTSRGEDQVALFQRSLDDEIPIVRIVAAEGLATFGSDADRAKTLPILLDYANVEKHGIPLGIMALNAINRLGEKAASIRDDVAKLPREDKASHQRYQSYPGRLIDDILNEKP